MKKKHLLVLSFVLSMFFISLGYSMWSDSFNIINKITTYEFSAKINVDDLNIVDKGLEKDKTCEFEIPLLKKNTTFDIENTGTIPIYIKKIEVLYNGSNAELVKKINYSGLVDFKGSDLLNGQLELSTDKGNFKKQDFHIEPLNSKETSFVANKNKLTKTFVSTNNIFEKYDNEIADLSEKINANKAQKENTNNDLEKRIEELKKEKSDIFEAIKDDKIKMKLYFEIFNN